MMKDRWAIDADRLAGPWHKRKKLRDHYVKAVDSYMRDESHMKLRFVRAEEFLPRKLRGAE